jgi:hypothetical protein
MTGGCEIAPEARVGRICELLAKAMLLEEARRATEGPDLAAVPVTVNQPSKENPDDSRLEAFIALQGEASPTDVRTTLGWPRTRVYHAVHRLQVAGRIVAVGQTRSLVYRISSKRAAQAVLN